MAYRDLREFIGDLEQRGQLRRIKVEVDPELEITEITDRVTKSGGPALYFEQVKGSTMPLVINLFGTMERMCLALGVQSLDEIAQRIRSLMPNHAPAGLMEKLSYLPKLMDLNKSFPTRVKHAPCQEVIERQPNLFQLPIMKCWPKDGTRYITFPAVITKHPETGVYNVGAYRMQVYDERTTGMHWQAHKDGAHHWHTYKKLGKKRMEVAVALGGDPVIMYAATAPLPMNLGDEYTFAGFIRREAVPLIKGITVDLEVPAEAEIVLEGYVDVDELRVEGPFGDHTGYYSTPEPYPVFHVTCVTHRKDAIYPSIIVGRPIQEDAFLGKATERIFLPLIQTQLPEIVDMNLPIEGVFHNCVIVSIRKQFPGHAKKVMHALWGLGLLSLTKIVIVVEDDVNIQDLQETAWKVFGNVEPHRDIIFTEGPVDALDYSSCSGYVGSKMGIDATRKSKEEGMQREWPEEAKTSAEIRARVSQRWKEYGLP